MSSQHNGQRRQFTAQHKIAILREHLLEKVPVSQVCDKHGLNPTLFYRWQKELFDHAAAAFEVKGRGKRRDGKARQLEKRVESLEAKLAHKDNVIAEITEDYVRLKKRVPHKNLCIEVSDRLRVSSCPVRPPTIHMPFAMAMRPPTPVCIRRNVAFIASATAGGEEKEAPGSLQALPTV